MYEIFPAKHIFYLSMQQIYIEEHDVCFNLMEFISNILI